MLGRLGMIVSLLQCRTFVMDARLGRDDSWWWEKQILSLRCGMTARKAKATAKENKGGHRGGDHVRVGVRGTTEP